MPPVLAPDFDLAAAARAELGWPGGPSSVGTSQRSGTWLADEWESTTALRWPEAMAVYDVMRTTDAQTSAVLQACGLPVRRVRWYLGAEGVDPRVLRYVETELGLHLQGRAGRASARRPGRRGVRWSDHVRLAMLKLAFGHMPFAKAYEPGPPTPDQANAGPLPAQVAHLVDLSPRMPRGLSGIDVTPGGDLEAIRQLPPPDLNKGGSMAVLGGEEIVIPAGWLAYYTHDREGADWRGRSMLRASYKHWMIADKLMRFGPIAVERTGMGLPVVTYDEQRGNYMKAMAIARDARAGETAGIALPQGYTFQLVGVDGQTKDELPLIRYHHQQTGKNALQMVLDLGHDTGARSLGDTFAELAAAGLNTVADETAETTTEDVVRDLVRLTFGEDEPYPPVLHDELDADHVLTPPELAQLVSQGVLLPDDDLEDEIRRRYDLPAVHREPAPGGDVVDAGASPRELAEMVQKIYLGVGVVLSTEEARAILNRAGGNLPPGGLPPEALPDPSALPPAPGQPQPQPLALPAGPALAARGRPARRMTRDQLAGATADLAAALRH